MIKTSAIDKLHHVDVEFVEGLSIEQIVSEIAAISNPQILLWYIGPYGLKAKAVDFYRDFLISPSLQKNEQSTFWLIDLTAWSAFKNPKCSIHNFSNHCQTIEGFLDNRIKCIRSSDILNKIKKISEIELVTYFRKALYRDFILKMSENFPNKNICVGDIFSNNCPIMADWYDRDIAKLYSSFQYLEGCLLIDEVFSNLVTRPEGERMEIVFVLPNHEISYYKDEFSSFQKDVQFLISKHCDFLNIANINIQIKFFAFSYGSNPHDRPYNASGKILKNSALFYEAIVGHTKNNEKTFTRGADLCIKS